MEIMSKEQNKLKYSNNPSFLERVKSHHRNVPHNYYFEDTAEPWTLPKLLPGHLYTFTCTYTLDQSEIPSLVDYTDSEKLSKFSYKKPFYDLKPIGLSLGRLGSGPEEYILNLKIMPPELSLVTLQYLFRVIDQAIRKYAVNQKDEMRPLEERLKNFDYLKYFLTINPDYFRAMLGRGIYFWVNKYNTSVMKSVQVIDFPHFEKLALTRYDNDRFVKTNGPSLNEIRMYYMSHLKNSDL